MEAASDVAAAAAASGVVEEVEEMASASDDAAAGDDDARLPNASASSGRARRPDRWKARDVILLVRWQLEAIEPRRRGHGEGKDDENDDAIARIEEQQPSSSLGRSRSKSTPPPRRLLLGSSSRSYSKRIRKARRNGLWMNRSRPLS